MTDYSFHGFVEMEYGPFKSDDHVFDFILEREEELREAFDEWCRENDEHEEPVGI